MKDLRIQEAIIEVIRIVREKGSLTGPEITQTIDLHEKTVYRALDTAEKAGLIIPQSNRYFWYEILRERTYQNELEAANDLKHSENLASGIISLLKTPLELSNTGLVPKPIFKDQALQHLQKAYRDTYNYYALSKEYSDQKSLREADLGTKTEDTIKQHTTKDPEPRISIPSLVRSTINDLKEQWRTNPENTTEDNDAFDKEIKLGEKTTTLKQLLGDQAYLELLQATRQIIDLEYRHYRAYQNFEEQATDLVLRVVNGSPLKGQCDHCPTIRIDGSEPISQ